MRTRQRKHLARVGEGCASGICHCSSGMEGRATLNKVTLVDCRADVFGVLTDGQWASLSWSAPSTTTRSVTALGADVAISAGHPNKPWRQHEQAH